MIRVAVVDDHEMFRAGVIAAISNAVDVVGQAGDVEGSIAMIADTQPDVVLLDVHVPGGNGGGGAEILTRSKAQSPQSIFLALSVKRLNIPSCNSNPILPSSFIFGRIPSTKSE